MGSEVVTRDGFRLHYHPAKKKKYAETVVFVHHMWGSHKTTARHYRLLNEKGFDCVSFDLLFGSKDNKWSFHPLMRYFYKGIFYVWMRQIRIVLDEVGGPKIIFAFSGPSLSSLWAAAGRKDIKKVIVDGGPFHHVYENSSNFFAIEVGLRNRLAVKFMAAVGTVLWGVKPLSKLAKVLHRWPKRVPIMSIRGGDDPIVNIDSIRSVFQHHSNLDLNVLELPYGQHLDGLKNFPDAYSKAVLPFIKKNLEVSK